ncbi:MAG: hypothetical protein H6828_02850 [Planctomycetes bacterium]|nr:hypothetical protein [Planctomycetota bacterium]
MTADTAPTLPDWVRQGWNDHADDAEGVMGRFDEALALVREPAHAPQLAALVVHVAANHLGRPAEGDALLLRLAELPCCAEAPARPALLRSRAVLALCRGDDEAARALEEAAHAETPLPRASTSLRVRAIAAGALADRDELERGAALFAEAVRLAEYGPTSQDPAAGALAMTANNLACLLEERAGRTAAEDALLAEAAQVARTWWEVAGSWEQVRIAEYRLAMTWLALDDAERATRHARLALELCDANDAADDARFFPYAALARARHRAGDATGARDARDAAERALAAADEDSRAWMAPTLAQLDALLG